MKTGDRIFSRHDNRRGLIVGSQREQLVIKIDGDTPFWTKSQNSTGTLVLNPHPHWRVLWDRSSSTVRVAEDTIETQAMRDEQAAIDENERIARVEESIRNAARYSELPGSRYQLTPP